MTRLAALHAAMFNAAVGVQTHVHQVPRHHHHHRFSGSPVDYVSLALASAASWIGLPGPGEPLNRW